MSGGMKALFWTLGGLAVAGTAAGTVYYVRRGRAEPEQLGGGSAAPQLAAGGGGKKKKKGDGLPALGVGKADAKALAKALASGDEKAVAAAAKNVAGKVGKAAKKKLKKLKFW